MDNNYDILWRWKKREYKYVNRLIAKVIDLLLVYFLALGLSLVIGKLSIELDIKMKYRLYILVCFLYELLMFTWIKTTIGKGLFKLKYISRDHAYNTNQFIIRVISYLAFAALSFEFRLIIPIILYYLIKSFDKFSGPYWDSKIKVYGNQKNPIGKYLIVFSLVMMVILFSLSRESLLKDYIKDYQEHSYVAKFVSGVFNRVNNEKFNEELYASYIINDYEGIINQYENDEFVALASADSYNYLGMSYMELGKAKEAIKAFDYALSINTSKDIDLESSIYNNLCWANNALGEYELAIEYGDKAIKLGDNSTYIYTNYGNALYNLQKYEEAISKYQQAIQAENFAEDFVYATIAECYYELEDYENAVFYFEKYKIVDDMNPQSYYDLAWSKALEANDYIAGLDDINTMVEVAKYSEEAIVVKAEYLFEFIANDELIDFLNNDIDQEMVVENNDLSLMLLTAYFEKNSYDETVALGSKMIKSGNMNLDLWYIMFETYAKLNDYDKIKELIVNYQVNSEDSIETLIEVAAMYSYNYFYKESGNIYEELVTNKDDYDITEDDFEDLLYEWVRGLYESNDFDEFIDVCDQYKDSLKSTNLYYFLGLGYNEIGEDDLALDNYLQAIEKDPRANYMYEDLIYLLISQEEFTSANKYLSVAKDKGLNQSIVDEIEEYISYYTDEKPGAMIFEFIEDNYMYYEDSLDFRVLKNNLAPLEFLSADQFRQINETVFKNDYFSFIYYGDDFRRYMDSEEEKTVTWNWVSDQALYVQIQAFSPLTDTEFLRVIKNVKSPKDKNLIIDLRQNYGGDLDSAMNILDYLLGNQFLGDWDSPLGDSYDYYSDGNQIEFKQIYVLTDDESASSSEIVALGIREYIKDSIIIGETTYGKGVGQVSMNNLEYEYALFVVNAYWNVNGINIHNTGIEPDIKIIDGTLDDYLNAILTN